MVYPILQISGKYLFYNAGETASAHTTQWTMHLDNNIGNEAWIQKAYVI